MKQLIPIFFVALVLLLPACFYNDSELYEVEPVAGDPPVLSVSTNLDTLTNPMVNDSLEVIYQVDIEGGELYYVYAMVAETQVFESDSIYGSFWINHGVAEEPGVDTLYLDFYYSTNSNSLADIVKYEALLKTTKIAVEFNLGASK